MFLTQHSHMNDDLFATPDPQANAIKQGYLGDVHGDGYDIMSNDVNTPASPDYSPDGGGEQVINGWKQAGTNAFDADVNRDRSMGAAGQSRVGAQLDQTNANQSRGLQMGALGLMQNAAQGGAPSRAASLGQASNDSAIRAGSAAAAGARGPGAAVAAMNGAQAGTAQTMGKNNAQLTDMRGQEMAKNMTDYASGAQHVEGQDIQAATTNAQLQAQQRALNEQRQQGFENNAWGVRKTQQGASDDYQREIDAQNNARNQMAQQDAAYDTAQVDHAVSTTEGILSAASDERSKKNIRPIRMGSLDHLLGRAK